MTRAWSEVVTKGDVDALLALYEPGATLTRRDGGTVTGHAALREAFTKWLATKPGVEAHNRTVLVAKDVALTLGEWTMQTTDPGGQPREICGRSAEVLRRQADATWRYVIDDPVAA